MIRKNEIQFSIFQSSFILFFIIYSSFHCLSQDHKEKYNLEDIKMVNQFERGAIGLKEYNIVDSVIGTIADTLITIKYKYKIIYYSFDGFAGVHSWKTTVFNDSIGESFSYCFISKMIVRSQFKTTEIKMFLSDKNTFTSKFSYANGLSYDSKHIMLIKENDNLLYCNYAWSSEIVDCFNKDNFINYYLKGTLKICW